MSVVSVEAVLAGNRRALARLITQVENDTPEARAALAALYPHTGRAHVIGVTGPSGAGKSTLVNELAKAFRRGLPPLPPPQSGGGVEGARTVAIVAVDPTSPFSGGAILGDRIRMRDLSGDPGVFIRSMATRGSLGGLARATAEVVDVLDAAGFDVVLVETVGAGQSEVDIARTAHTTLVIEAPGLGDDVQAIKAGILEIADVLVVNKADLPGADAAVKTLTAMLDMTNGAPRATLHHGRLLAELPPLPPPQPSPAPEEHGWRTPVLRTVANTGEGVEALAGEIVRHRAYLAESGELARRQHARVANELDHLLRDELLARLLARVPQDELATLVERVVAREQSPHAAAAELLAAVEGP
jgi:LAO/AO transport system kinase